MLVGIAKLASESELLEAKRRVRYFELPTRSLLTKVKGQRLPFRWTINPYRGCEFGCRYCYARYTHEFMGLEESSQFEEQIYAKDWNPRTFRDQLRRIRRDDAIALGTATDPYQPAERRYGITRKILEVFAREGGHRIGIVTKSDLVTRDIDLFREIAKSNVIDVNLTITTLNEELARLLEPYAPRPALRVDAVKQLADAGVSTGVLPNPIVPVLTDSEISLDALAAAVSTAGARSFGEGVLFLQPCAQKVFFPFLEQHFPHLLQAYKTHYEEAPFLRGPYVEKISERLAKIRQKYQLRRSGPDSRPAAWPEDPQLLLFNEKDLYPRDGIVHQ
jgi:DNA repair photolyase